MRIPLIVTSQLGPFKRHKISYNKKIAKQLINIQSVYIDSRYPNGNMEG